MAILRNSFAALCSSLRAEQTCDKFQFLKEKICVNDLNWEVGVQMRVTLVLDGPLFYAVYR